MIVSYRRKSLEESCSTYKLLVHVLNSRIRFNIAMRSSENITRFVLRFTYTPDERKKRIEF